MGRCNPSRTARRHCHRHRNQGPASWPANLQRRFRRRHRHKGSTDEICGKATDRPDGFTVLNANVTENVATVAVEPRQNGSKSEVNYRLARVSPTLLNDNWALRDVDTNIVSVSAGSELSAILVNGVEVSVGGLAEGAQSFYPLPTFPGTCEISMPATSKFMSVEPVSVAAFIVKGGMPASAQLSAKTNAAFDTAVQEKVSTMFKSCAEKKTLRPEGCPFSACEYSATRNVAWKITKEPTFEIHSYEANSWQLGTDEVREASASYERDNSYGSDEPEWEKKTDDARIYLRGVITVNNDELTVEFSNKIQMGPTHRVVHGRKGSGWRWCTTGVIRCF